VERDGAGGSVLRRHGRVDGRLRVRPERLDVLGDDGLETTGPWDARVVMIDARTFRGSYAASLGTSVSLWALTPAIFVLGLGMGAGFSSIFNIALGDIAEDEAGSASGSLEAVQQLAGGAGSALVASLYIGMAGVHAMTVTLIVVLGLTVICAPLVGLLPKKAFVEEH